MVRKLRVRLILISFLISTFPLKNVISTRITFSDECVSDDAFSLPFSWGPEEQKKGGLSGMWAQYSSLRHVSIFFAELCELCNLFMNTGRIEATVFVWGHSIRTFHLNSRCWLLALSVICCHPANSGATTSRYLVGRKSAISIKVHIFLHLPWKA